MQKINKNNHPIGQDVSYEGTEQRYSGPQIALFLYFEIPNSFSITEFQNRSGRVLQGLIEQHQTGNSIILYPVI